jgi:hypothetical protein
MNTEMEIIIRGYQVLEKKVKDARTTGRIYLPKEWVDKQVKIVLLEPATEEDKEE